jgi:uncharacterized protein YecT (DUF1311 family)
MRWEREAAMNVARTIRRQALLAVVALALSVAMARADDADPIDAALDACLASDKGQTTAGTIACTGTAIDAWDGRLNETYRKALAALDPKSRDLLRTAQRQWVAFRAAEKTALGGPWQASRGTVVQTETMGVTLSAIKERVAELRVYLPPE